MPRHVGTSVLAALAVLALGLVAESPARAQRGGRGRDAGPARPTPRRPDGVPVLGQTPDDKGIWAAPDPRMMIAGPGEPIAARDVRAAKTGVPKPTTEEVPFQPWAKKLWRWRQENEIEPYTRCKPAFGVRMLATPYGTDIIDVPEEKRIYVLVTGGPHNFRPIYLDGRPHPKDLDPSYFGHSVGQWEGDTLVIDTIGYNERSWIDRNGTPTTHQLHTIERITRPDFDHMTYEITVDDPGAYTATWKSTTLFQWRKTEQFEFLCQDANLAPELSIGSDNVPIDRRVDIVP